jgi:thiamine-monophosphate kinase
VTGRLGGSLASGRHLTFLPRVLEAAELHGRYQLKAMIDISDGLLADVLHICEESGVGATLYSEMIPRNPTSTLKDALNDGEDFELAFCLGPVDADRLRAATPPGEAPFYVGKIIEQRGIAVVDGKGARLNFESAGWVHRW